jgi:hypothetical protein
MDRFVDYMITKRGMADALRAVIVSGGNPFAQSLDRLTDAVTTLVKVGSAVGTARDDVDPRDLLATLSGVALAAGVPDQRDEARPHARPSHGRPPLPAVKDVKRAAWSLAKCSRGRWGSVRSRIRSCRHP